MQLDVGQHLAFLSRYLGNSCRIETELPQRFGDRRTGGIACVECRNVQRAAHRAAAEHGGAEAHAFLIAKAQHLDGEGQALARSRQRGDAFDAGNHAEHAVVAAGVAHGVEVGAEHQARQPGAYALVAPGDVADRIERRLHAGFAHPAEDFFGRGTVLAREEDACQSAGELRVPRERVAALHDAGGGRHGADSS